MGTHTTSWRLRVWTRFLAPVDQVWEVKTDPGLMRREFWPWFDFRLPDPEGLSQAVRQGHPAPVEATLFPWGLSWQGQLVESVPGERFVDVAQPNLLFDHFEHRHVFEPTDDGTRYIDDVQFQPASGLPDQLHARATARFFAHRHRRAARHLPHDERATAVVVLRELLEDEEGGLMLIVIDVGNTNTVLGALDGTHIVHRWRVSTRSLTTDEFGLLMLQLFERQDLGPDDVHGVAVSCVVPSLLYSIEKACRRYLSIDAMVVGRGIRTGMRVRTDNPREVGADRIVNAVAALDGSPGPLVVVDFGTATTFDCVSAQGDYVGGAIAPGFRISADALFERTAKLPRVEVERPARAIGTNTIASMQSGLFWGYVGLVDGLAARCKAELAKRSGKAVHCVATGGLSNLIGSACDQVDQVDTDLTLHGLRILWERNS